MIADNPFSRQRPIVRTEAKETYCNAQRINGLQVIFATVYQAYRFVVDNAENCND